MLSSEIDDRGLVIIPVHNGSGTLQRMIEVEKFNIDIILTACGKYERIIFGFVNRFPIVGIEEDWQTIMCDCCIIESFFHKSDIEKCESVFHVFVLLYGGECCFHLVGGAPALFSRSRSLLVNSTPYQPGGCAVLLN